MTRIFALAVLACLLPSCASLSNRSYVEKYPFLRGIKRVAVFTQRWPCYQQLPRQVDLGEEFIKKTTAFGGPWAPTSRLHPRAVDVREIDDLVVGELLVRVLEQKGYEPFLAEVWQAPRNLTVQEIMAQYQSMDPHIDGFLFCHYSPTLFYSHTQDVPKDHGNRSYSLMEIVHQLRPGDHAVTWAGPRADKASPHSISHAFVYISLTLFRALDWQALWQVADAQAGGKLRTWTPRCLPAPTEADYPADASVIQNLMVNNLSCRLRHLIPGAF